MRIQNRIVLSFAVAFAITPAASAQRRAVPAMPDQVGAAITLQIAGQPYHFEGKAVCQYEPAGYIYTVAAQLWRVQQSDEHRSVALTFWRPKNQPGDVFSLNVGIGGKDYVVNTVKFGGESNVRGSGTVTVTPSGTGATFTINAKSMNGAAITGTMKCSALTHIEAVGG